MATKLNVLRGYPPFDSNALTQSAVPKSGEAILSGMLISLDDNRQFIKGKPVFKTPFWAVQDQSAPDVAYAGKLTGLVGLFGYELETPYFAAGVYNVDAWLKDSGGADGKVSEGAVMGTDDLVGIVSRGKYLNKDKTEVVALYAVFYPAAGAAPTTTTTTTTPTTTTTTTTTPP